MDTKKLRQKILDLAIRGKLVPQDPNDEPASVLLERIRAEKQQLIKEGKIKAPKGSKACDTSHYEKIEGPFEIPESWEWCRVADIANSILYGVSESAKPKGRYKLLRITDIQENKVDWNSVPFTNYDEEDAQKYLLNDGDILFARTGATVGKSYLVADITNDSIYASYLIRIQTSKIVLPEYVKRFFESGYYWEQISSSSVGVGQPNVNGTSLANLLIPIPPFREQKRIVLESEKWLSLIESIDKESDCLSLNIERAKSLILNLAITGMLVPQDSNDEPAIELLKRINPDFKPCDNSHYGDLPIGWSICTLYDICKTINGLWKGKNPPFVNVGVIRNANFTKDFSLDYSKIEYIDVEQRAFEKRNLEDGDLIVEKSGGSDNFPVGRSILYQGESDKYSFSNFTMALRIKDKSLIRSKYLYFVILHKYLRGEMTQMQTQTTGLHNLLSDKYMSMSIPMPPTKEQDRIVGCIEKLLSQMNQIKTVL